MNQPTKQHLPIGYFCKRRLPEGAAFYLAVLIGLTVNAQTINLSGIVSNSSGQPINKAVVALVRLGIKDTTSADGKYSFSGAVGIKLPAIVPQTREISINNGVLQFTLNNSSPVKIEVFNPKGILLKKELLPNIAAGVYRFNIEKNLQATNLLVIKASIGNDEISFRYMPLNSGKVTLNTSSVYSSSISGGLAKMAAVVDTLVAQATGFNTKSMAIGSYDNQQENITLDSAKGDFHYMGNPPGPSIGCGKDLGSLKSGIYSITSAGLSRKYVIDIPANYDKNHPYRLIFGMHCNCGTMYSVRSEKFYEIKRCADSANVPCIFVAPSAYATNYDSVSIGCPGWNQSEKDHTFFDDMLALFKSELCVDTTRVFSGGFSFGAMFSNSLAQNHQKVLRGVIIYEGANVNIYVPKNTGLPIAYMGLVGLSDPTCTPAMGRACRDTIVKYNGCTVPSTVPETTKGSKTHVIYDYQGCPNYPVKWCTYDGDHQWAEYDGVSSGWDPAKTWTAEVAWHFIYQF